MAFMAWNSAFLVCLDFSVLSLWKFLGENKSRHSKLEFEQILAGAEIFVSDAIQFPKNS